MHTQIVFIPNALLITMANNIKAQFHFCVLKRQLILKHPTNFNREIEVSVVYVINFRMKLTM